MVGVLSAVRDYIESKTSIKVVIEPNPITLNQPHIRLTPTEWQIEKLKDTDNFSAEQYTAALNCSLKLVGSGDGPDAFLTSILSASFKLHMLFFKPFSIPLIKEGVTGSVSVYAKHKTGGEFFVSKQEGVKPFVYQEEFDLSIFIPYSVLKED